MPDLLLEIGLEEVPARMLAAGERELSARVLALVERERLHTAETARRTFSTPRRLAVLLQGAAPRQPDAEEQLTGPAWSVAFKNGEPTPAAHAFAKKAGVEVSALRPVATAKGEYTQATLVRPGRAAGEVLAQELAGEIAALSWPKPMYWREGKPGVPADRSTSAGWKPERFVRPVQWLVALLDGEVLPVKFAGVRAGRESRGHRILHGPAPVALASPDGYAEALRAAFVEPEVERRRHTIRKALDRETRAAAPGARWREDHGLIDEVTNLTEWPAVLAGGFAPEFLELPEEVLVTVMRDHQKYFALEGADGKLLPRFLAVLNAEANPVIRHGNERVLRARFSDARFFWGFDRRTTLDERRALLAHVTFHKDLGSYEAKTERTLAITKTLGEAAEARGAVLDRTALARAAALAKLDLTTELVKEFTELQGIVGGLYARAAGEPESVAAAIYHQYRPAAIADPIPPTAEGQILGLADRMGTLADLFQLGLQPSGSRDPYALRRAGNAVIKILALSELPLTLADLLAGACAASDAPDLRAFLRERLAFYLEEVRKLPADAVAAALNAAHEDVPDAELRASALAEVRGSEDLLAVSAAWKRTKNILRQAAEKGMAVPEAPDPALLADAGERALYEAAEQAIAEAADRGREGNYPGALSAIAGLRPPIDRFFDATMVMVEDEALRGNRLALLGRIVRELGRLADFSELAPV